jgi:hypothetical protein
VPKTTYAAICCSMAAKSLEHLMRILKFDSRWAATLGAALCLACGVGPVVAQDTKAPMRWINASQVNLRDLPALYGTVLSRLAFSTQVRFIAQTENTEFCEIETEAHRGYMACRFLSTVAPPAPVSLAGAAGAGQRWVTGSGVNLRSLPSLQAAVIEKLGLNTMVRDVEVMPGSVFCRVRTETSNGYTACQYLALTPMVLERVSEPHLFQGGRNVSYDPVRSFWLAPSWSTFTAYGRWLKDESQQNTSRSGPVLPDGAQASPRLPNAEFDRMKAHLAKGIYGKPFTQRMSWDEIKRMALSVGVPVGSAGAADELPMARVSIVLSPALKLWDGEFGERSLASRFRFLGFIAALDLPAVRPSHFKSAAEVAGPGDKVEDLSGRFNIIHTYRTKGRALGPEIGTVDGLWDVGQVAVALTQPLVRTTVYRTGRLHSISTHATDNRIVWGESEPPTMCYGYIDGFSHGQADWPNWRSGAQPFKPSPESMRLHPMGSLLSITTRNALPVAQAKPVITTHKLNRDATGFAAGTWMHFDLDGDGVSDLAVWEGVGRGAGHLEDEPLKVDDPHHRLFFVNIAGQWQLLGADTFSYGCGC